MTEETDIAERLGKIIIGQEEAIKTIVPFVHMHSAGLTPGRRPIGVVMLLGPTGCGKTASVEALAQVLHGNPKHYLRVDCGEFQMEHEVAKLIGSPPGYLGHRETSPLLSQQKINGFTTTNSDISIVLFDEIEKAAFSLSRILLGVFDKGRLILGDNSEVKFDNSLIFLTSNLGAKEMSAATGKRFGMEGATPYAFSNRKLSDVANKALKKRFSPEFVNRIDASVTYLPLGKDSCSIILQRIFDELRILINNNLGVRGFDVSYTSKAAEKLLLDGVSAEYGARELKRVVLRTFTNPLAVMCSRGKVAPGTNVVLNVENGEFVISVEDRAAAA